MSWDFSSDMPRLRRAVDSAPSIFNQRPWELRLAADDRVELYTAANETLGGRLPREVVISCGAALYNLRLAIKVAGRSPSVWLLPGLDPESGLLTTVAAERTLLASVEVMLGRAAPPTDAERPAWPAAGAACRAGPSPGRPGWRRGTPSRTGAPRNPGGGPRSPPAAEPRASARRAPRRPGRSPTCRSSCPARAPARPPRRPPPSQIAPAPQRPA
jgi:hypothetical protein